jgi:hypothetical protein
MSGELTEERRGRGQWDVTQITPLPSSPQTTLMEILMCSFGMQAETVRPPWVNSNFKKGLFCLFNIVFYQNLT